MDRFKRKQNDSKIIDGKAIAQKIRSEIKDQVSAIVNQGGQAPGLAVIQVGRIQPLVSMSETKNGQRRSWNEFV